MKEPLATHDYASGGLQSAVEFFRRTRDELRTLRMVRVATDWVRPVRFFSGTKDTTKDTKSTKVSEDVSSDALVFDRLGALQAERNPIEYPIMDQALFVRRFKQLRPPFTINLVTMDLDGTTDHTIG